MRILSRGARVLTVVALGILGSSAPVVFTGDAEVLAKGDLLHQPEPGKPGAQSCSVTGTTFVLFSE